MAVSRWSWTALGIALVALALVADASPSSGRVFVTADGRIGPLHVDESTRADVVAFAGPPDSEVRGRYITYPSFDALGYGCAGKPATDGGGAPKCETVFYLDAKNGKLMLLYTEDTRYTNLFGIHVGTPTAVVERALHKTVYVGCLAQLQVATKRAFLALVFSGGTNRVVRHPSYSVHLVGGHVGAVVVHSQRLNPGVLDCIDSG